MAGRPAGSRGGDGTMYGLIAFAVLTVASLGAFIWQLTGNKALEDRVRTLENQKKQFGQPPSYYADEATNRQSTQAAVMYDDLQGYAALVSGQKESLRRDIEPETRKLLKEIAERTPDAKVGDAD